MIIEKLTSFEARVTISELGTLYVGSNKTYVEALRSKCVQSVHVERKMIWHFFCNMGARLKERNCTVSELCYTYTKLLAIFLLEYFDPAW